MRGHTPTMLLTTSTIDGIDSSPVIMARRRLVRDIIQSRCWALFNRVTKIPSLRRDPKTQRRKRTPSANTASGDADQKWDTPPACASTHFPNTPCTCQPAHATRQKSQQRTPNYPLQAQLIRALEHRGLNQLQNGRQHPQRPEAKCPSPTFA